MSEKDTPKKETTVRKVSQVALDWAATQQEAVDTADVENAKDFSVFRTEVQQKLRDKKLGAR